MELTLVPIRDEAGAVVGASARFHTAVDHDRDALDAGLDGDALAALVHASVGPVAEVDGSGQVCLANGPACGVLGVAGAGERVPDLRPRLRPTGGGQLPEPWWRPPGPGPLLLDLVDGDGRPHLLLEIRAVRREGVAAALLVARQQAGEERP